METETATQQPYAVPSFVNGLRALADALEADDRTAARTDHPPYLVPLRWSLESLTAYFADSEQDRMVAAMRFLKQVGFRIEKDFTTSFAKFICTWPAESPYAPTVKATFMISRNSICTAKVVGTERKQVRKEVKPAEYETVEEDVDVIEWDCKPVLDLD
jgi:hypothetical protein